MLDISYRIVVDVINNLSDNPTGVGFGLKREEAVRWQSSQAEAYQMPMAMMVQDDKGSQSFILSMNLEQECFDYFTQDLLEDNFNSWQVEQRKPLETEKNGFKTHKTLLTPTQNTKRVRKLFISLL